MDFFVPFNPPFYLEQSLTIKEHFQIKVTCPTMFWCKPGDI